MADKPDDASLLGSWKASSAHVRRAIKFIRANKVTNPAELVEWDSTHGRKLFDWDDESAAAAHRLHQARLFCNRFRAMIENKRIRLLPHVREDATLGIPKSGYVEMHHVMEHPGMRSQVVSDIVRRMEMLARELDFWQLTEVEQRSILDRVREALKTGRVSRTRYVLDPPTSVTIVEHEARP